MKNDPSVPVRGIFRDARKSDETPRILVCVDLEKETREIIPPAKTIARALDAELAFVHVIETHGDAENGSRIDPVEWDIKCREAKAHMARFAEEHAEGDEALSTHLLEGRSASQICALLGTRPQDIAVLGRGHDGPSPVIGETARQILESGVNSLLLVPVDVEPQPGFAKILVPLDCSGRSERVMPLVEKIARSEGAELVLVHVVPEAVLTGAGPGEPNDKELTSQVSQRNERVAKTYLDHLCGRIRASGLKVRSIVLNGGDVRRELVKTIEQQAVDLLVVASHGHSGFADVPFGDVASFLIKRSSVPTLVMRFGGDTAEVHAYSEARSKGVRQPGTLAQ